jgi:GNAT superfamily N-acetyltransferase
LIQSVPYNEAPELLRLQFALLSHRANPGTRSASTDAAPVLHDPALDTMSFYASLDGEIVSYAAVIRKTISHGGQTYTLGGLSWVATDPDYRRRGFGSLTVSTATRWMECSDLDIGLFSCDPPLASFYARAGAWPVVEGVVLIGSRHAGALRSDTLGKVVLMRLFSAKANVNASTLRHTTIDLDLPVGQFL